MPVIKPKLPSPAPSGGRRATLGLLLGLPCLALTGCAEKPQPEHPLVGKSLPEFSLTRLSGDAFMYRPREQYPLVLNFWATWCAPCRAEMGGLERVHQALAPKGLELIGISLDEDINLVREYLLQEKISFPIYRDPNSVTSRRILGKAFGLPTTVLVGRDGVVRKVVRGERRWDESPELDGIQALLA